MKRSESRSSLVSVASTTSQEVERINSGEQIHYEHTRSRTGSKIFFIFLSFLFLTSLSFLISFIFYQIHLQICTGCGIRQFEGPWSLFRDYTDALNARFFKDYPKKHWRCAFRVFLKLRTLFRIKA